MNLNRNANILLYDDGFVIWRPITWPRVRTRYYLDIPTPASQKRLAILLVYPIWQTKEDEFHGCTEYIYARGD